VVFVVGVEEHLIPHERALRSDDWRETEEERRLLFVGMTRAMQRLYLTLTRIREFRGRQLTTIPSRFLTETVFSTTDLTGENFYDHDVSDDAFFEETENQDVSATTDVSQAESTMSGPLDLQDGEQRPLLMTGADLLNGTGAAAPMPTGFAVGMTVRHPKYGQGTVTSISGFAKRRTVTVVFQNGDRSETFVAAKCPLQPVGIG
jgi:DNA helicase-2/ATP-dependent DNA helicase PcrA